MTLTPMQTLILWILLVRPNGAAFQKDLGLKVTPLDRGALVSAGLVRTEKRSRSYWLEVTEKGWDWAGGHLDAELPKRVLGAGVILQAWLARLKVFMEARGVALADILVPPQRAEERDQPALHGSFDSATIPRQVREAYLALTGGRLNERVLLKDLREKLRDVHRDVLDKTLAQMHLEQGTTLSGLNNPRDITPEVREAGLMFKGQPMFVLWITK